ncbi:ribonuclease HII [Hydrogenimonas urashimensis]|uniref:ribonuclease HII n=1 Tax=Hydrogenimonas urashimensis TaxID=2740515 RepID=UPI0019162598|nr:ribonuclease HII [Hydrogenimonas urashimensis]
MKSLCGIDEAGRGPLAGPLVMAGVILYEPIEGLTDSKKLTEKRREALYETIVKDAAWHIVSFDAAAIDKKGISACLIAGLKEIMRTLLAAEYLFDGNTTFGIAGLRCQVKADLTVPQVSAASILAKVTRDRTMVELAKAYPAYGFERHKGYGTQSHIEAIRKNGYTPVHRRSYRIKALEQPTFDF